MANATEAEVCVMLRSGRFACHIRGPWRLMGGVSLFRGLYMRFAC